MLKLVQAAIRPIEIRDVAGTCGCCWVRQANAERKQQNSPATPAANAAAWAPQAASAK